MCNVALCKGSCGISCPLIDAETPRRRRRRSPFLDSIADSLTPMDADSAESTSHVERQQRIVFHEGRMAQVAIGSEMIVLGGNDDVQMVDGAVEHVLVASPAPLAARDFLDERRTSESARREVRVLVLWCQLVVKRRTSDLKFFVSMIGTVRTPCLRNKSFHPFPRLTYWAYGR